MSEKKPSEIAAEQRRLRQEEMLKANLKRRKEQARARSKPASALDADGGGEADGSGEG
ncbi:MAG: hypothetical protein H7Y08_07695 [Rhizobiaceae bacterium]|nr:hypothetical protein [Rhizobiaceae bacterium]